mmetsp:Transcript_17332/g.25838  ORF Transcript_17332/g.25838 Transcript_17332/m.25838 type:complete len:267 (+) Transcript_17332:529-1329(+)
MGTKKFKRENCKCTYPDSHTSELSVKLGNDLSYSLGSTSGCRDHVGQGGSSTSPVLSTLRRTVDNELSGCCGVDCGHKTLLNSELVVDNLSQGGKAVGSTRRIGDNIGRTIIVGVVDAHYVHRGIAGRGRDDDLLGTTLKMRGGLLNCGKDTSRLANVVGTSGTPANLSRITLSEKLDSGLSVNHKAVSINLNSARIHTMHGIMLELVCCVIDIQERVVHGNNCGIWIVEGSPHNKTSDTPKSVDANACNHFSFVSCRVGRLFLVL